MFPWTPDNVIKGIDLGIDLFSGSYPFILTQRGEATVFNYKIEHKNGVKQDESKEEEEDDDQPVTKKQKLENDETKHETESHLTTINLHDMK